MVTLFARKRFLQMNYLFQLRRSRLYCKERRCKLLQPVVVVISVIFPVSPILAAVSEFLDLPQQSPPSCKRSPECRTWNRSSGCSSAGSASEISCVKRARCSWCWRTAGSGASPLPPAPAWLARHSDSPWMASCPASQSNSETELQKGDHYIIRRPELKYDIIYIQLTCPYLQ